MQVDELDHEDLIDHNIYPLPSDSDHVEDVGKKFGNVYELIEGQDAYGNVAKKWRKNEHKRCGDVAFIGNGLLPLTITDAGLGDEDFNLRDIVESWCEGFEVECVKWLNSASHKRPALVHGVVSGKPLGRPGLSDTGCSTEMRPCWIPSMHTWSS